jgi:ribosome maturation factor RimP
MREDSRRGAPRSARAPGRAGQGRDSRAPRSGRASWGSPPRAGNAGGSGGSSPRAGTPAADDARAGQTAASRPGGQNPAVTARLTSLIESVLTAMEIDLEAVKITSAGRRVVLRIVVDADGGVSLDDIAEVSREVSAKLDAKNAMGEAPYTLEVTSPGVDRPLTQQRHWRRATGRLVVVPVISKDQESETFGRAGHVEYLGRIVDVDQDRVTLDVEGERRIFSLVELGPGKVQVEFGRLDEIDDADDSWQGEDIAEGSGPDTAGGSGGSLPRISKEEPDGH